MNLGIPVWEDKISPVFDTSIKLLVLQIDGQKEIARTEINLEREDIMIRCQQLQELKINTLLCGAISRDLFRLLTTANIEVISWISGPLEKIINSYLNGDLSFSEYHMPGYRPD